MGAETLLKRSGTVMSIESIVMRPSTLGFWASLPLTVSARSAVAATTLLATSCACLPVTRIEPGKPAAGSSRTSPVAEIDPPSGVAPLNRSMRIVSPLATRTPVIPVSLKPVSIVAELAVRQPDRPLRLGLGDGPAQLEARA